MWRGRYAKQLLATRAWERDELDTAVVPFSVLRIQDDEVLRCTRLDPGQFLYEVCDLLTWQPTHGSRICDLFFTLVSFNSDYVVGFAADWMLYHWSRRSPEQLHILHRCSPIFKLYDHVLAYSENWPIRYEDLRAKDLHTNTSVVYPLTQHQYAYQYAGQLAYYGSAPHVAVLKIGSFLVEVDLLYDGPILLFPSSGDGRDELRVAIRAHVGVDWKEFDMDTNELPESRNVFNFLHDSVSGGCLLLRCVNQVDWLRVWSVATGRVVNLPPSTRVLDNSSRVHFDLKGLTAACTTYHDPGHTWIRAPPSVLKELWPGSGKPVGR